MKRLLCAMAAVVAMAWVLSGPVSASVLSCAGSGTCYGAIPDPLSAANPIGAFGDVGIPAGLAFADKFKFQLVGPPSAFTSITNEITTQPFIISNLVLSLWLCGDSTCTTGLSQVASNNAPTVDSTGQHISLSTDAIIPGYYFVQVAGTYSSNLKPAPNAGYTGSIHVIAETPLPGALPLFVSGLGALGFVGWRKRKKATLAA